MMISASNMLPPKEYDSAENEHNRPTTVLVLPSFTFVEKVTPDDVEELVRRFVDAGPMNSTTSLQSSSSDAEMNRDKPKNEATPSSSPNGVSSSGTAPEASSSTVDPTPAALPDIPITPSKLSSRPCPHAYIILLCSQTTRDARCGQSAPLLRKEFERHLRPLGLQRDLDDDHRPGGVGIYFISHVGGHKYAANVIVYRKEAQQAIWLARVRPEDCEGIVKQTVLKGKVVNPQRQLRGGFDRSKGLASW